MTSFRYFSLLPLWALFACSTTDTEPTDPMSTAMGGTGGTSSEPMSSGGGTGGTSEPMSSGGAGAPAGDPDVSVGAFVVDLVPAVPASGDASETPAYTSVVGRVNSGPTPRGVIWDQIGEGSGCVLLEPRLPFCDPACGSGRACVEDDVCQDYPEGLDAGTVTLAGLALESGGSQFDMDPLPPSNTYQPLGDVRVAYPPFGAGESVTLQAGGAEAPAFSLEATGIDPLEVTTPDGILFEEGSAVSIEWTAGTEPEARVTVVVDISHHGGQTGEIDCDVPDTGSVEISAELVKGLLDLGWSGFPSLQVTRLSVGSSVIAQGRVDLVLQSSVVRHIEIPGLMSCLEDMDCADGQTCTQDRRCQ